MARILVTDDEDDFRQYVQDLLTKAGHDVTPAHDGLEAIELLGKRQFDLLVSDMQMPRLGGLDLLRRVRNEWPELEVVMLTAFGSIETAVEAMRLGAYDYIQKHQVHDDAVRLVIERALEHHDLLVCRERSRLEEPAEPKLTYGAPAMELVLESLKKVAPTGATVLLMGESGTGKEVAARAIHRWSKRASGPFMAVNCAALSESLLESELFGHEKGAFTGAHAQRPGRIEMARGGTFFLDEIGEMRPELQVKLLRVLQERTYERVGGARTIDVDVRWIAATNADLPSLVRDGGFREDLYHRLAVFPVRIPPLRERAEDVAPLARALLERITAELGREAVTLAPDAELALARAPWSGNVRELRNTLERAVIMLDGSTLSADDLLLEAIAARNADRSSRIDEVEKETIAAVLAQTGGNRMKAAEKLGIAVRTLHNKLNRYGLR